MEGKPTSLPKKIGHRTSAQKDSQKFWWRRWWNRQDNFPAISNVDETAGEPHKLLIDARFASFWNRAGPYYDIGFA